MHNLVYLSAASHLFSDDELVDILNKARLNNKRLDVTGLLLYSEGSIIQILEGEKETLFALFDKIKRDHRHKSVLKMIDSNITKRSFSDWSMGFKQISKKDLSALNGYFDFNNTKPGVDIAGSGSFNIIAMIKSFADVNKLAI